ncbi:sigma-70 family RNA polymerase sigma factor [Roseibacillus persicicus]|nr:sigma-70 family RNA polymerase sigma factor [Roseibacillus persicicus]
MDSTQDEPFQEGDEEVMMLIASHQSALQSFLRTLLPVGGDVEDILQRVNLVVWRKRSQFVLGSNFKAWSFAVARWEALSYLKERKRESWLLFDSELAALVEEEMASRSEPKWRKYQEELADCLRELSSENQHLIHDRYGLGMSVKECSRKWKRSEGGLRVTLHRLRGSLRDCLERKMLREES